MKDIITLQLLFWFMATIVFTIVHAYFDSTRNGKLSMADKPIRFVVRIVWLCTAFVFIPFWPAVNVIIMTGAYCWLCFDFLYNVIAGNDWMYIGDTSQTEKLAKKIFNKNTYFIFKLLLLIASVIALPWVTGINSL